VCEGECGTPECGACPDVGQVVVPGGFTIAATEVSNSQYAEFLGVDFTPAFLAGWLPAECGWKTDFTPDEWPGSDDVPVAGVDWCDAWAYCEWSGQRLCGRVGGGAAALNEVQNPQLNEWFKACTQGGVKNFPYALNYNANACNGMDAGVGELTDIGSLQTCVGGYAGIFDMSGNVWEWENACDPNPNVAAQDQECHQRGGSFYSNSNNLRCSIDSSRARNYRNDNLGIRCCDTP
jgi:formylglycine-generating enzyme required for sulfatase activity